MSVFSDALPPMQAAMIMADNTPSFLPDRLITSTALVPSVIMLLSKVMQERKPFLFTNASCNMQQRGV